MADALDVTGLSLDELARRTRAWLEEHLPAHWRRAALAGDRHALAAITRDEAATSAWYAELGGSGLATPSWPVAYGGLGLAADGAAVVNDELARLHAGRPMDDFIGVSLGGPTIIEWGTDAQKERYLRPITVGRRRWCQLFSEPGAGSDLASLTTKAVRREDGAWVVNGQKVWSSFSDRSDHGLLMARTDPGVPKHKGITYFLVDMHAPGVQVRPLRQLNGHSEFGEVFLTDVVVPDADRLGPVGAGWAVAMTTLMQERSGLSGRPGVGPGRVDALAVRAKQTGAWDDPVLRDGLLRAFVTERALQMTTVKAFADLGRREPGAEGSIRKLVHGALDTTIGMLATEVEPGGAIAWDESDVDADAAADAFLSSKILSIAGGTTEIQRNIIGERVLGLPRDRDPYADTPFDERPVAEPVESTVDGLSSTGDVRVEPLADGVLLVELNRPARLNAMSVGLVEDLHAVWAALARRPDIRVVVLTGAGRGFCAGLDLVDYGGDGPADSPQRRFALQERIAALVTGMRALPQVVIAAVNGPAAGGGLALALGADVRIAAPAAKFAVSFVKIGLSGADIGVSWLLPRLVGASAAFELLLTGRLVDAAEALRIGLVGSVADDVLAAAAGVAAQVVANSPMGVRMTKQVMWSQLEVGSLAAGIDLENRTQIMTSYTADHTEAVAAFLERRPARFTDT